MHQPYYKDSNGEYVMPWVFTHAIKDYYDMAHLAVKHNIKAAFNLVPSLIIQLKDYYDFNVNDRFLNFIKKKNRNYYENSFILDIIQSTSINLVNKFPRFKSLLNNGFLNITQMNDLEVFFLLAHCGDYLRENNKVVSYLLNKTSFSWEDKLTLLRELHSFIKTIIPLYQEAFRQQKIDISTTPFYHPILPLLLDINSAEDLKKPALFADFSDDAKVHIEMSIKLFEREFGKKPIGIWPAEGAISDKTVNIFKQYGIKWTATDESILHKTDPSLNTDYLYTLNGMYILFRNRQLSDNIGFKYQYYTTKQAMNDLNNSLKKLNIIILDGENAWEYYQNPADFLESFYREINKHRVVSCSELIYLDGLDRIELNKIASGSWINADFSTWIGDDEKNRAWEMLSKAKLSLEHNDDKEAKNLLLADEGSDWFWWYGDTNYTKQKHLYGYIFKNRIAEIYKKLNKPFSDILTLIADDKAINRQPISYIKPKIDGKDMFFEYINAGTIRLRSSSIHQKTVIDTIKYGYDEESNLYLAIHINPLSSHFTLNINGVDYEIKRGIYKDYAIDKIFEIKLPFCKNIHIKLMKTDAVEQEITFEIQPIKQVWIV